MIDKRFIPLVAILAGITSVFLPLNAAYATNAHQANGDKPLVSVNGAVLTNGDLEAFTKAMSASRGQHVSRTEALNTLIDRELLYQEALSKGRDKKPEVLQELNDQRRSMLANIMITDMLRAKPATDAELHKIYKERVLNQKLTEYKARHILVKTEGEAKDIIAQLDKGADFATLAKAKSIDTGSAAKGGDLGWFNPAQMVPEFSKAMEALQKGHYTKTPVKSQFGWHVILREDSRPVKPPTFAEIKPRLEGVVQSERVSAYVKSLRDKAKIENK
ncbi:MAG: peptidylprolyl isomerase [Gammaproteobacteria bacterium]